MYHKLAEQQLKRLELLKRIRDGSESANSTSQRPNIMITYESDEETLDKIADKIIAQNKEKAELNKLKLEIAKINEIKNSIYDKQLIQFDSQIIDFAFIPLLTPNRANQDIVALAFATNDQANNSASIEVTDMRGDILLKHSVDN
jgi:hypothetical protein